MRSAVRQAVALVFGMIAFLALVATVSCSSRGRAPEADTYLRWVSFEVPINENVTLRWPKRKMPLRVHLPAPPEGLFDDPGGIHDSVRDAVMDWSDVVAPGLPSFEFVDDAGDADIPIVWAAKPDGNWYIAHCAYDINLASRRFGVARILVTGSWGGHKADLHDVYATVLHEMGHALGLGGHSPVEGDIMYESISATAFEGLSARDRATLTALYARPIGSRVTGAR